MREIKFRGKRVDNGEWVYGGIVGTFDMVFIFAQHNGAYGADYLDDILEHAFEVDPSTVGQYTGLKDKNGKEIYEGDIIQAWRSVGSNGELRGQYAYSLPIVYAELWCQFVAEDEQNKTLYPIWQSFGAFEVIGNIHDNPELLKE